MAEVKVVGHARQWQELTDMAGQNRLPSALGFVGPSGVGKKAMAIAFAEYLGCKDLHVLEAASESYGGSYKVEQIQNLKKTLSLQTLYPHRIVILDEAERLNPQSANALLKMIEEPPEKTHFILVTSSLTALLPTIRSRLLSIRFFTLSDSELKQVSQAEDWLLKLGRGRVGELEKWNGEEALSLFDQVGTALLALKNKDLDQWLEMSTVFKEREKAQKAAYLMQLFFRDQIFLKLDQMDRMILPFSGRQELSFSTEVEVLVYAWKRAQEMERSIAQNADRSLLFQNYFYEMTS